MESTTTFIRWTIVLLTNHVSVQERLHTEIDSVIGRERLPTLDDQSRSVIVRSVRIVTALNKVDFTALNPLYSHVA